MVGAYALEHQPKGKRQLADKGEQTEGQSDGRNQNCRAASTTYPTPPRPDLEVGFEAIDEGLWNVYFGPVWLGRFHEEAGVIVDRLSRTSRGPKGTPKVLPIR